MTNADYPRMSRIIVVTTLLFLAGCEGEITNNDDCILKHLKSGMNKNAVYMLEDSCRTKYPQSKEEEDSRSLTPAELKHLSGRAGLSHGDYFAGTMYNGNRTIRLTEIELAVYPSVGDQPSIRNYREAVSIAPLTTSGFGFSITLEGTMRTYSWALVAARGIYLN